MNSLDAFFSPASVAIVGVSEDPTKLGSILFNNMMDAGYEGKLYPINPKHQELYWHKVYPSVLEVPEESLDLVCIIVPAQFVVDVMKECATKHVKSVIIITAGFREIGEEGKKLENEIVAIAKQAGIRVMGPNCLGLIAPASGVNASFAAATPVEGNIAFLSQSGAFCTAILDMAMPANLGFSYFVSVGNKCDVNELELVDYWLKDPKVGVISAYIEEMIYGQEFLDIIKRNNVNNKPVVVFKPGKTDEAKKAISSHTGSMAGSIQTFKTAMAQHGVIEAGNIREFFNMIMGFSRLPMPKGQNIAIITNAGGPGIIATDQVVEKGFKMAVLSEEVQNKLKSVLPATANIHNPVDVIGDALADRYQSALEILGDASEVDVILVILTPQLVTQIEETAKTVINAMKIYRKPILPILIGNKYTTPALTRVFDKKFAAFSEINDALDVLLAMYKFGKYTELNTPVRLEEHSQIMTVVGTGKYRTELQALAKDGTLALTDEWVTKLALEVGLDTPRQTVVSQVDYAVIFAADKYPVVMKATNNAIAHKTDFKAVYLNLSNEIELRNSFNELTKTITTQTGNPEPEILIQEQIKHDELLFVGANRDGASDVYVEGTPGFGHLLAFGQGGIYTEIYKDIAYGLVPSSQVDINTALSTTKISKIMAGARGKSPLAYEKVVAAIMAVQKLVLLYPEIASMDINPLLVGAERAVAVDIKIFV